MQKHDKCLKGLPEFITTYSDSAPTPYQDYVHPVTGVSDCPQRKHLCENPIYRQLMAEQCPLTCNKCNGAN
ncbi:unnamed protein product [Strongylus vulgaris]|uniref:ShKT domain-containing protein n=1 Tax=Strongylus vulgaris TaxID=40348 RepID=A0A3P7IXA0_STRVU|nr:unnamed protein product [Strongylus vulgaris]